MRRRPAAKAAEEEKPKRTTRRRPAAAKSEETTERSSSSRRTSERSTGRTGSRSSGRTSERSSEQTSERSSERSTGRSSSRTSERSSEQTSEPSGERRPATRRRSATAASSTSTTRTRSRTAKAAAAEEKPAAEEQPAAETSTPRTSRRRTAKAVATEAPAAAPAAATALRSDAPAAPTAAPISDEAPASIEALGQAIIEVRRAIDDLGSRIENSASRPKVGVFVDVPNVLYGADHLDGTINMGKLLEYLVGGREVVRATAYSPVSDDPSEPVERQRFVAPFVPYGYRIVTKPLKRFADGSIKGNFDVEMAIDMVTMAERLDVVSIVSGDSDFARLVEVIQGRGVRVEVVAFAGSTSVEMRSLADRYIELGAIYHLISD